MDWFERWIVSCHCHVVLLEDELNHECEGECRVQHVAKRENWAKREWTLLVLWSCAAVGSGCMASDNGSPFSVRPDRLAPTLDVVSFDFCLWPARPPVRPLFDLLLQLLHSVCVSFSIPFIWHNQFRHSLFSYFHSFLLFPLFILILFFPIFRSVVVVVVIVRLRVYRPYLLSRRRI